MPQLHLSSKRLQISKANVTVVIVMSIACFVTIFSLVAARSLISQRSYQASVIDKKEKARDQLKANQEARTKLVEQYKNFVGTSVNIIGGSSTGSGERDGDNAKLILDALPSKYDFPATATSLDKLVRQSSMVPISVSGIDNELEQNTGTVFDNPTLVEVPFELAAEGSNQQVQDFLLILQQSIRPIKINKLTVIASSDKLTTTMSGVTYYQPEKQLSIKEEIVR